MFILTTLTGHFDHSACSRRNMSASAVAYHVDVPQFAQVLHGSANRASAHLVFLHDGVVGFVEGFAVASKRVDFCEQCLLRQ